MASLTNLISVITAVHEPSVPYLMEAYESLASQELPAGWAWQWVVQEDGRPGTASAVLPADPRISADRGRKGGAGTTRNLALARAEGSLVRVLDADDRLTPGALAREIEAFTRSPDLGWTTAAVLDLLPDGSTVGWAHADPPEGPFARDHVLDYFRQHDYRLPVHPATLCIRRDLALALGGWMALPGGEDTGLLLAASVIADGYFVGKPGLLYRKHPDQITGQPAWTAPGEWLPRMRLIEARALALKSLWDQRSE